MNLDLRGFGGASNPGRAASRLCRSLMLGLVAVLATACAGVPASPPVVDPMSMPHVHALVTNPADGSLLAGTHEGVVRIEDGKAVPVGTSRQDIMGLAMAGPDRFYASGHPEPGASGPPHLGLIASNDGAKTWSSVSLAGQADFHTLVPTTAGLYGYNSVKSTLMFSKNRTKWTDLLTAALYDIAADPNDPTHLLLTAETGVRDYRVGTPPADVPETKGVAFIEWVDKQNVVGLTISGEVKVSPDGGQTWSQRGTVDGDIEALGVGPAAWHVATTEGIFASTDGGRTWDRILGSP